MINQKKTVNIIKIYKQLFFFVLLNFLFTNDFGRNIVQYKDFDWYYVQTEHFDIYVSDSTGYHLNFLKETSEDAYNKIQSLMNWNMKNRVSIIIYSSHNDFQQTNVIGMHMPEGVGGVTELLKNRVVIPFDGAYRDFKHVIYHELVHAFINDCGCVTEDDASWCLDCEGVPYGEALEQNHCLDTDGDGLGNPGTEMLICSGADDSSDSYVLDCSDPYPDCELQTNSSEYFDCGNDCINGTGDIDGSGTLSVSDLIMIVNLILVGENDNSVCEDFAIADNNYDGYVDIQDLIAYIYEILDSDNLARKSIDRDTSSPLMLSIFEYFLLQT